MARRFRFGAGLVATGDARQWQDKCRRAEQLGYDVVLVPDHLGDGVPAPFPPLVAAAAATERVQLGTFVLNAGFWNPALLAREVETTARLTEGRLELGLGTGYVRDEFDDAGLPWESAGARVDRMQGMVVELTRRLGSTVPLLIAGNGNRVLRMAAAHADTVAFSGLTLVPGSSAGKLSFVGPDTLAERVQLVARAAGDRDIERNILVQRVEITENRRAAAERLRSEGIDLTVEELLQVPTLLLGTVGEIAEQLRGHRENFGLSYIVVLEDNVETLAPVIDALSGE